jgi:hypothetical protein
MVGHRDRLPAVDLHVAQPALECGTPHLALEALALDRQAGLGARQARDADALLQVERRLGSFSLALRMGLAASGAPRTPGQEGRLLVDQRAGRAGQDALHRVAGEVAGLFARVDVGHADAEAVDQVGQLDGLHRADLHALAALDARGEEVLFVERARAGAGVWCGHTPTAGPARQRGAVSTPPASRMVRSHLRRPAGASRDAGGLAAAWLVFAHPATLLLNAAGLEEAWLLVLQRQFGRGEGRQLARGSPAAPAPARS